MSVVERKIAWEWRVEIAWFAWEMEKVDHFWDVNYMVSCIVLFTCWLWHCPNQGLLPNSWELSDEVCAHFLITYLESQWACVILETTCWAFLSGFLSVWSVSLRVHGKWNYLLKMAAQSLKWRVISFILSVCDYMVSVRRNISQDLNTTAIVCRADFFPRFYYFISIKMNLQRVWECETWESANVFVLVFVVVCGESSCLKSA